MISNIVVMMAVINKKSLIAGHRAKILHELYYFILITICCLTFWKGATRTAHMVQE